MVKPPPEKYTDLEIIDKIRNGEVQLYEILIRRNNSFLYRIGRAYAFNHHDTEDLMQETYISAYFNLSKFEHRSSFRTWITRIMLNHCYRKKQRPHSLKEIIADNGLTEKSSPMFHQNTDTQDTVINKELGHLLEAALHRIPEDYRMVFALRELNGLSVTETAESLNITEANVKVRLNRAKGLLRTRIEKMYSREEIFEFNLIYCDRMVEKVMDRIAGPSGEMY